jgi:hypothetical protein
VIASTFKNEDFIISVHDFADLQINAAPEVDKNFYYFYDRRQRRLIKQFILDERPRRITWCRVTLIKKGDKFTPRLAFSIRDKHGTIQTQSAAGPAGITLRVLRASVNLEQCYDEFWQLISFMQSLREIEVPRSAFSLMSQGEAEIVTALRGRDAQSIVNIIKQLSSTEGVKLSQEDINHLLKRRDVLARFARGLKTSPDDETKWQNFFERNKWIFGYGLNYQILRQEQTQPHYGGTRVDGRGGQRGDYLTSTLGDINFTVLVEIKTPGTPLLQGKEEIRSGAWSLSKDLTDALSQIEANIDTWIKQGSVHPDNRDKLEGSGVYTVQPKGIIVIGTLAQVNSNRSKRETFQRFRRSIHGIDIITFDELYERAKYIVEKQN